MALFFNKEEKAEAVFEEIRDKYENLKAKVRGVDQRPTVISGVVYGDTWFLPGGQNYAAKLMEDAGCHYLWSDNKETGFLELSFESVYEKAHAADYWIGTASYNSFTALREADRRYADFKAFKQRNIYSYNARMGAKGGSEFLELGYLRPDLILADMVKIVHPDLLPAYTLYFHRCLNE